MMSVEGDRAVPRRAVIVAASGLLGSSVSEAAAQREGAAGGGVPVLQTGHVPIGSLGHPLGSSVTIEGVRLDGFKTGVSTLRIDAVNGRKPKQPMTIWVDNVALPKGERCMLKGYEMMRMLGVPPAWVEAERERTGREPPQPQAGWQVQLYFVALSAIRPEGLPIRERPKP